MGFTGSATAAGDLDKDAATYYDVINLPEAGQLGLTAVASGQALFAYFTAPRTFNCDRITMLSRATVSSGLTLCKFGLFTIDGTGALTCVARTASDTTIFNTANTPYERVFDTTGGFPATYQVVAGVKYALGVLQVGTTPGNQVGANTMAQINTGARRRSSLKAAMTDFTSTPVASVVDDGRVVWCSLGKV